MPGGRATGLGPALGGSVPGPIGRVVDENPQWAETVDESLEVTGTKLTRTGNQD